MSAVKKRLASYILKEHFGDIIEKVGTYLSRQGLRNLRDIVKDTELKKDEVQKALCVLIQHRLVTHEQSKKKITLYNLELDSVLLYVRFPRFQYSAKTLYGDTGELIVGEIQQHGCLAMSMVIRNVVEHSRQAGTGLAESEVKSVFTKLVQNHFLRRIPLPANHGNEEEEREDNIQFALPPEVSGKRKRSTSEKDKSAKRQKTGDGMSSALSSEFPDKDILWCMNYDRFHQLFLEEEIITAAEKKFDSAGAEIVRAILKKDELTRDVQASATCTMTLYEIAKCLPKSCRLENSQISQHLSLMADDHDKFIKKVGEGGGGTYTVNIKNCVYTLCLHTVQSIIQERYGSDALRIFRLLLKKDHLEQKQIGELAMIPSKDAKELLYKLFSETVLSMQEIPKTTDYAPSRTIYLFSVNLKQISRTLLERCYQTLGNLMNRRRSEIQDNSRVLEKQERMDATVLALKAQHGDQAAEEAAAEFEELITEADREQLRKLKLILNKLQQSELQVDGTLFLLDQYISN